MAAVSAQMQCAGGLIPLTSCSSCESTASGSGGYGAMHGVGKGRTKCLKGLEGKTRSLRRCGDGVEFRGGYDVLARGRRRGGCGVMYSTRAQGFNLWEAMGGRGLVGGEKSVNTEKGFNRLISEPEKSGQDVKDTSNDGKLEVTGIDGFDKELSGLVGGFPGGERGLGQFLRDFPPPSKATRELEKLREGIGGPATKATTIRPPLLMPGMNVVVKSPENPYHSFTGIVQRVTDGRVGVLFEGGNWDKLVAFRLEELERSASGPPMNHPKSAILLQKQQ